MIYFVGMTTEVDHQQQHVGCWVSVSACLVSSVCGSAISLRTEGSARGRSIDSDCSAIGHDPDDASGTCYLHKLSQSLAAELGQSYWRSGW